MPMSDLLGRNDPTKQLKREIEAMELKKQSLVSAVKNEIATAQRNIDGEKHQIGTMVYQSYCDGVDVEANITAHFEAIDALEALIIEKEEKIKEIVARYDDELGLLQSQLAATTAQTQPSNTPAIQPGAASKTTCGNCGKVGGANDMFCMGCGTKLK